MSNTTTHLTASCNHCGAPQPLSMARAAGACAHCGHPSPLPAEIRASLDGMRAELTSRDERTRQLTASALVQGDSLHSFGRITVVVCWALFGSVAVYVSLDHDVPLGRFLAEGRPDAQWWLLWSFALGVPLSFGLLEAAVARVRRLAIGALPAPPLVEGAEARCRCCGAELPKGGVLRRCSFCRTDNLVVTGRYRKAQDSAERAIDDMAKAFNRNLQARIEAGDKLSLAVSVFPLLLLFGGPAGALAGEGQARLWLVPAAAILFAVLAALVARHRRLPVEELELLTMGQQVYVRDHPRPEREVCAQLMGPSGPVSLLGRSLEDADLGVATSRRDDALTIRVYRVKRPEHPLQDGEREQLVPAELWKPSPDGPPTVQHVWWLTTRTGWRTFVGDELTPHLSGNVSGKPPEIVVRTKG